MAVATWGGPAGPGCVAVEEDDELAAVASLLQLEVLRRERGPAHAHDVSDACLVWQQHVEVALDEDRHARLADRILRLRNAVQHAEMKCCEEKRTVNVACP
jgi:hypothetical protein